MQHLEDNPLCFTCLLVGIEQTSQRDFLSDFTKYATCGLKEARENASQRVAFVPSDELPKVSAYN